jgi:anti-sigma factor RsiW
MSRCREIGPLLAERASGQLRGADEARVAAHLEGCPSCRSEADRLIEIVELVRAPAASPAEERGAAALPARILAAARRPAHAPFLPWRWIVPIVAAGSLALILLIPSALHLAPAPRPGGAMLAEAETAWEEPDADALWDWAAVADADGAGSDVADAEVGEAVESDN